MKTLLIFFLLCSSAIAGNGMTVYYFGSNYNKEDPKTHWCSPCAKMKTFVISDEKVKKALDKYDKFVIIQVDREFKTLKKEDEKYFEYYTNGIVPTTVVINSKSGEVIGKTKENPGAIFEGLPSKIEDGKVVIDIFKYEKFLLSPYITLKE